MAASAELGFTGWTRDPKAPAFGVVSGSADDFGLPQAGFITKFLDGRRMTDIGGCFREFLSVFQLPCLTGWDSLNDWMRDLSWLGEAKGYLTVVHHAGELLKEDAQAFDVLVECAQSWADYWHDSAAQGEQGVVAKDVPFRVLLHTTDQAKPALAARLDKAEAAWAAIREGAG